MTLDPSQHQAKVEVFCSTLTLAVDVHMKGEDKVLTDSPDSSPG